MKIKLNKPKLKIKLNKKKVNLNKKKKAPAEYGRKRKRIA